MKKTQKKNLVDFEKFLSDAINDPEEFPLTNEEIIEILKKFGPPQEVDNVQEEELVSLMKKTHERRIVQQRKLNNPTMIRSLGELLKYFCEFYKVSTERFASFLGLTVREFYNFLHDRKTPDSLGESRILTLSEFTSVSINDMIGILDRTIKLIKITSKTNIAASSARTDKRISESDRSAVILDAMQELLLAIEELNEDDKETSSWIEFKERLLEWADKEKSPFKQAHLCYTLMKGNSLRVLLDKLSKQL
jgi:hypothetical protein